MSDREREEKRAESLERRHEEENLMLRKRQEEYRVIEEVFDRLTVQGVVKLISQGVIDDIHGVVNAGKEARVYFGQGSEGEELAIKIYYTSTAEFRKGMMQSAEGRINWRASSAAEPTFIVCRRSPSQECRTRAAWRSGDGSGPRKTKTRWGTA